MADFNLRGVAGKKRHTGYIKIPTQLWPRNIYTLQWKFRMIANGDDEYSLWQYSGQYIHVIYRAGGPFGLGPY